MQSAHLSKDEVIELSLQKMQRSLEVVERGLREKVALTCQILFSRGHDSGLAGQITARTQNGKYLTQQLGLGFDEITPANLLEVDRDLGVIEGDGMPNPANRFHSWIYDKRPDVRCIVHTHALHTTALSMLGIPLEISHMDACLLYGDVAFLEQWPGIPVGNEEGRIISEILGDKRAALLAHHGMIVAGRSVEEACVLAVQFERAAQVQLMALGAGGIAAIPPALGLEAREWLRQGKRYGVLFDYYVRRLQRSARGPLFI